MTPSKIGILLTNIGTPSAPTPAAVRLYLKKFLSDRRIIELPRVLWWPILHGFILRFRPKRSAKLYQQIWTQAGSPLLTYSNNIKEKLQHQLNLPVALGMHYSDPSIAVALEALQKQGVTKLFILPLYPQYSATTTASSFDFVVNVLKTWRTLPEIRMLQHYAENTHYIHAISTSIKNTWEQRGQAQHLLFSFHGIPKRYALLGDPYPILCQKSAELIAKNLQLADKHWSISFQSRLGPTDWLTPYTEQRFKKFPAEGITDLQVICPGFATDCLETLEEINLRGKEEFILQGGKSFHYIPALNDDNAHIEMLTRIISKQLESW